MKNYKQVKELRLEKTEKKKLLKSHTSLAYPVDSISERRLHCQENNRGWIIRTARVSPTSLCVRLLDVNLFVEIKIRLVLEIISLCVSHAGLGLPKAALK